MRLLLVYIIVAVVAVAAYGQDLEVVGVTDGAYPEILVRARVLASVDDSVTVTEKNVAVPCRVEESGANIGANGGRMHVFLVEDSYYFHKHGVFPQIKKSLMRVGGILGSSDNANILYFGHDGGSVRYVSAEQTSDFQLLAEMTGYNLRPQLDSSLTGNDLSSALSLAVQYCRRHSHNHETIVLTLVSRGLHIGSSRRFADGLAEQIAGSAIYLNVLVYDSESENVKRELQELAQVSDGCYSEFTAEDIEPVLAQSLEKMGKAKYREYFKDLVITFNATQSGVSNSFTVNFGNTSVLCEYTNPSKSGFIGKYPQAVSLLIGLALAVAATVLYFKYRMRIIRKIDSSTQTHVDEIKRQNRMLKQEIEKYKRHPLNMAHKFDNIFVEETLIGAGKIVPKLVTMDGDRQQVFNVTKLTMTIGRNEANDIVLENRTVSGIHATLTNEGGFFFIADNDSTNGIFVNDIRISKSKITTGDRIRIGAVLAKIVY